MITNIITNKIYVGKTSSLERRWQEHSTHPFNSRTENECPKFYRAIRKYGISNFRFEIIDSFENEIDSFLKEEELINNFHSQENSYNIAVGGNGFHSGEKHPQFGKSIDDLTKKKISISLKGHLVSDETKDKTSNSLIGKGMGENNTQSKISDLDAWEIKRLYLTGNFTQAKLAEMFNVKRTSISYIINVRLK